MTHDSSRPAAEAEKPAPPSVVVQDGAASAPVPHMPAREIGGPAGPEPTRYGDWERGGRCVDF